MQHARSLRILASAWLLPALLLAACYGEPGPRKHDNLDPSSGGAEPENTASGGTGGGSDGGDGGRGAGGRPVTTSVGSDTGGSSGAGGTEVTQGSCDEIVGEPLPARLAITSDDAPPLTPVQVVSVTKAQLWKEFERQTCGNGSCHGGSDDPLNEEQFRMTQNSFDQRPTLGDESLARVTSSNPEEVMPPGSGDGSTRSETDPVLRLAQRLKLWQDAGFPETLDIVIDSGTPDHELPEDPYLLSPALGEQLTNIGNCVPDAAFSMNSPLLETAAMEATDAMFAAAEDSDDLPDALVETDLVSLESSVLAQRGVYSYAPTYTLFSDNAGKMRHVRVPVGKSIRYNPETKDFDIPDNTRFYKTFLKKVKDADGNVGYRKMETRLIVVRRDEARPGGGFRPRALRTSYAWDKGETMALRVKDPLRSGEPFADRLCPYVVDESVTRDPTTNPISDDMSEFCSYMTAEELGDPSSGQVRHYGIPSAERCDQCHMGSSSRSYILGFTPWQVDRRAEGEGGIYESPTADELNQLARLISYGVITGIEPGDAKLEESQGDRKPRNEYELKAQAYMMGNCAFCHNPNGFPVVQNPVLVDFNMFPDEANGGIFQFSLERYSPRAKAGRAQSARMPYITPAFGDHNLIKLGASTSEDGQANKEFQWDPTNPPINDPDERPVDYELRRINDNEDYWFSLLGPWRSLIWRNVYTPFTYNEDYTIFIHMPRNVPGYDCRAQKIMADWMLSIPSRAKDLPLPDTDPAFHQPYEELREGDDGYSNAVRAAERRLEQFHASVSGQHCPTDDDIIDPRVVLSDTFATTGQKKRPSPTDDGILNGPRVNPDVPVKDVVPDHAHWVPTDTTDTLGDWAPRRPSWKELLTGELAADTEKLARVIDQLQSVQLSDEQRDFSLEPVPMGTWSPACQDSDEASSSPTVEELRISPNEPMQRWLTGVLETDSVPPKEARVHFESRGEAVFQAICQNCHGRQADSRSPLAATILELTGGQTRVANFIDGLFGPVEAPGAFARDEFMINQGASPETWQARYMLFMGLGGTQAPIPRAVLDLVATSPFYGQAATAPGGSDPNMLDSAYQRCRQVLVNDWMIDATPDVPLHLGLMGQSFVGGSAHYELWESLCTFGNDPFVRVFDGNQINGQFMQATLSSGAYRAQDDEGEWLYPPDHPVGNPFGQVEQGIDPENTFPWCIEVTDDYYRQMIVARFAAWEVDEDQIPFCPEALFAEALGARLHKYAFTLNGQSVDVDAPFGNAEFTERWLLHGAMNTGIAAYYYLDNLIKGRIQQAPPFDHCED